MYQFTYKVVQSSPFAVIFLVDIRWLHVVCKRDNELVRELAHHGHMQSCTSLVVLLRRLRIQSHSLVQLLQ